MNINDLLDSIAEALEQRGDSVSANLVDELNEVLARPPARRTEDHERNMNRQKEALDNSLLDTTDPKALEDLQEQLDVVEKELEDVGPKISKPSRITPGPASTEPYYISRPSRISRP